MDQFEPSSASTATYLNPESSPSPASQSEHLSRSSAFFITAAGVGPTDPNDWRELKYFFRLRTFRSNACETEQYVKVKRALASLSKEAVRRRQVAFSDSRKSGESWSQMHEEEMWIDALLEISRDLETRMGVSSQVKDVEHLRGEGRANLAPVFADWGQSESTGDPGASQAQASWLTKEDFDQAAEGTLCVEASPVTLVRETPLDTCTPNPKGEDWMLVEPTRRNGKVFELDQFLQYGYEGTNAFHALLRSGKQILTNSFSRRSGTSSR